MSLGPSAAARGRALPDPGSVPGSARQSARARASQRFATAVASGYVGNVVVADDIDLATTAALVSAGYNGRIFVVGTITARQRRIREGMPADVYLVHGSVAGFLSLWRDATLAVFLGGGVDFGDFADYAWQHSVPAGMPVTVMFQIDASGDASGQIAGAQAALWYLSLTHVDGARRVLEVGFVGGPAPPPTFAVAEYGRTQVVRTFGGKRLAPALVEVRWHGFGDQVTLEPIGSGAYLIMQPLFATAEWQRRLPR